MDILFSKKLYKEEAIDAAAAAFSDVADIFITVGRDIIGVGIKGCAAEDKPLIQSEFSNYVLSEMRRPII
ncbi:MAG: HxsD-like protein [Candidatus Colwellbacteria bacterium]|nr:HxsD-like protein [Candidatus Colwellbacteria bacterium]